MKRYLVVAVVVIALLITGNMVFAGGRPLSTALTGAAEVPGPGDPDGSGTAHLTLNQGQGEICFTIEVADIAPATAAHIHAAPADQAGPVVVNFNVPVNGLSGCVDVDADLIKAIRQTPSNYYVNVHNADFPAGAIRGQLTK
jgi:hypothetical protein